MKFCDAQVTMVIRLNSEHQIQVTADILPSSSCHYERALDVSEGGHVHMGGDQLTGAVLLGTMLLSLGWSYWLNCFNPNSYVVFLTLAPQNMTVLEIGL